ncbi:MAG: hypothetical protein R6U51_10400 [Anaerolineales bacterium]
MNRKRFQVLVATAVWGVSVFGCRPVIAVGWSEILILGLIIAFVLYPWLVKVLRFYLRNQEQDNDRGEDSEG